LESAPYCKQSQCNTDDCPHRFLHEGRVA
jgi:hypothetical protein